MTFIIDDTKLTMRGWKGDSGSFVFNFDTDMDLSSCQVYFYVKKYIDDSDDDAVITKTYSQISNNSVTVNLTTNDTKNLEATTENCSPYFWGIKLCNSTANYGQTLIPKDFDFPPLLIVYPEIIGGYDD